MKLGQSRFVSIIEACLNTFSGMFIAFAVFQLGSAFQDEIRYIYPGFTCNLSAGSNIVLTLFLTGVSIIRTIIWRRIFNKLHEKHLHKKFGDING